MVITASQWFKNGDHPEDYAKDTMDAGGMIVTAAERKAAGWEGSVVRYFRHPYDPADRLCQHCRIRMHDHGWIDTLEGGHTVCPGDWIITGVAGELYPCKPGIFAATYEPVPEDAA